MSFFGKATFPQPLPVIRLDQNLSLPRNTAIADRSFRVFSEDLQPDLIYAERRNPALFQGVPLAGRRGRW